MDDTNDTNNWGRVFRQVLTQVSSQVSSECNPHSREAMKSILDGAIRPPYEYSRNKRRLIKVSSNTKGDFRVFSDTMEICDFAFAKCVRLLSIQYPSSLRIIMPEAFAECVKLKSVEQYTAVSAFDDPDISLPDSIAVMNDVTSQEIVWKKHFNQGFIGNRSFIGNCAFKGCVSLESITLPESITAIGDNAFQECSNLTSIIIPDSVISIGRNAFEGCKSLRSITLGRAVESIGDNAFEGCDQLCEIQNNSRLLAITEEVFKDYSIYKCNDIIIRQSKK